MSLVVEFQKGGRVGMLLLQMNVVNFRLFRGEPAVLTDVNLTGYGVILKSNFVFPKIFYL